MNKKNRSNKTVYIFLTFLCIAFWLTMVVAAAYKFVEKKYVYPLGYKKEIIATAEKYDIDAALLFGIVKTESGFNPQAVSVKGAVGLMQILPSTGEYIAAQKGVLNYDLFDVNTNLDFGVYYWKYLQQKFQGSTETAAAYNAGEGTVGKWLKNDKYSDDGIRLKEIPYAETKSYVKKISESEKKYRKLYGKLLDK